MEKEGEEIAGNESTEGAAFNLDADMKEARIAARRKRVLAKIEADKRAAQGEEDVDVCSLYY